MHTHFYFILICDIIILGIIMNKGLQKKQPVAKLASKIPLVRSIVLI